MGGDSDAAPTVPDVSASIFTTSDVKPKKEVLIHGDLIAEIDGIETGSDYKEVIDSKLAG